MSKPAKRAADGMPFSLVGHADRDPIAWLETFPRNAALLLAFLEKKCPDALTSNLQEAITQAARDATSAQQAIAQGMAKESTYAAMRALQGAWSIETLLGAVPRVQKANDARAQRRKASASASEERASIAVQRAMLARKLADKVSTALKQQGKSAVARKVKELASKEKGDDAKHLSKLGLRQLATLIFD